MEQLAMAEEKLTSFEALARQAAATKLQAIARGRRIRKVMSRKEGDLLWYSTIKPVVVQVFRQIGGSDGDMDIQEFNRWLNAIWKREKLRMTGKLKPEDDNHSDAEEEDRRKVEADKAAAAAAAAAEAEEAKKAMMAKEADETNGALHAEDTAFDPNAFYSSYYRALAVAEEEAARAAAYAAGLAASRAAASTEARRQPASAARQHHPRDASHSVVTELRAPPSGATPQRERPRSSSSLRRTNGAAPLQIAMPARGATQGARLHMAGGGRLAAHVKPSAMPPGQGREGRAHVHRRPTTAEATTRGPAKTLRALGRVSGADGSAPRLLPPGSSYLEIIDFGRSQSAGLLAEPKLPELSPRFIALRGCVTGLEESVMKVQMALANISGLRKER